MASINFTSAVATVLCGAAAVYVFLWTLLHLTHGKDEPPMVSTSVPFISPILGSKSPIWDWFIPESVRGSAFTLNRPLSPNLQGSIESFGGLCALHHLIVNDEGVVFTIE